MCTNPSCLGGQKHFRSSRMRRCFVDDSTFSQWMMHLHYFKLHTGKEQKPQSERRDPLHWADRSLGSFWKGRWSQQKWHVPRPLSPTANRLHGNSWRRKMITQSHFFWVHFVWPKPTVDTDTKLAHTHSAVQGRWKSVLNNVLGKLDVFWFWFVSYFTVDHVWMFFFFSILSSH